MTARLDVLKTYKLLIDGKFPRSESGRTVPVVDSRGRVIAHICRASRKDLREAVEAARKAQPAWAGATAYLRGQILYRMAEMLEGKKKEFQETLDATAQIEQPGSPTKNTRSGKHVAADRPTLTPTLSQREREREVESSIDRLVAYAGWADKYAQVLGCNNPVSGPYYNFTVPEPTGVVAVVAPDEHPLLALVSLIAPVICSGNTVVALASQVHPLAAAVFAEVCATSDVPGGVINLLTGIRKELLPYISSHRDIDAVHAAGLPDDQRTLLREGVAENIKRVVVREGAAQAARGRRTDSSVAGGIDWYDAQACQNPWWIEPFVEMKTIWHPASS